MRKDNNYATGYFERVRGGELTEMDAWDMGIAGPAGGINSSVNEMIKWLQLHMNNGIYQGKRLFFEKVMKEMHRGVMHMSTYPWEFDELPKYGYYGMAWKTMFYRGMPMTYHYHEITGKIDGYYLKLEPVAAPVWFEKRGES